MVTMSDVARAAGVSTMTVSNVLNERRPVAPATRERVLASVESLGYEMNQTARNLRAGRTGTIALIVPSFFDYYSELADAVAREVEPRGSHLVLERTAATAEHEMASVSGARLQLYDGVIMSSVGLDREQLDRIRRPKPIVLLGERDVPERFDHVRLANEDGARMATAHMIERGSRRILALGATPGDGHAMTTDRRVGWEQALRDAGLPADERYVVPIGDYSFENARAAMLSIIDSGLPVDGVFAMTDVIAIAALGALHERGLRVPDDVQVAGFDDLKVGRFLPPALTSIDPGHEAVAREAVRLLHRRMDDPEVAAEHVSVPVTLSVRGTTR
ncbi:LacI family DNA-binding transcriptional regulator [Microbacterium sp. NEAU-LLB]|uniref:LacI family DNA-binding transcriptional regulator n=2 Tax=Microbacterium stercoris TaxID=2820289 RepID=A0A939TW10_9MICO|nr:LacI family DNA-binding transcriptional regulator [Microbacterium stercoris]